MQQLQNIQKAKGKRLRQEGYNKVIGESKAWIQSKKDRPTILLKTRRKGRIKYCTVTLQKQQKSDKKTRRNKRI